MKNSTQQAQNEHLTELKDCFTPSQIVDFLLSMNRSLIESEQYENWESSLKDEYHLFFHTLQTTLFSFSYRETKQ